MWQLVLLLPLTLAITCSKYGCHAPSFNPGFGNTCVYPKGSDYSLQVCPLGQYCNAPLLPTANVTCSDTPEPVTNDPGYPGEPCTSNANCLSGQCTGNNLCAGLNEGVPCNTSDQCNAGLYCKTTAPGVGTCAKQLAAGANCLADTECANNLGCDKGFYPTDKGTCTAYYSKAVGDEVQICVGGTTEAENNLCQSGVCTPETPGSNLTKGTCSNALTSSYPKVCQADTDCGAGNFASGTCTCGRNSQGLAYCQPYSGDAPKKAFRETMQTHLSSPNINRCHTLRRFSDVCVLQVGANAIGTFLARQYWAQNAPALINNDDCVKNIFSSHAYYYEEFCPQYGCQESGQWPANTCTQYNDMENRMYARECKSGQYCDVSAPEMNLVMPGNCTEGKNTTSIAYPGEACKDPSDCSTNQCDGNKCTGVKEGGSCLTAGCDYGLQCDAASFFTCKKQIAAGGTGCESDLACVNNAGCNNTLTTLTGTCVDYFTVHSGGIVACDQLDGYGVNYMCSTGAAQVHNATEGTCMCIDAPKSINNPPFKCSSSQECLGDSDSTSTIYQSKCSCGFNKNGEKYCEPFLGDKEGTTYLSELSQLYSVQQTALFTSTCPSDQRHTTECLQRLAPKVFKDANSATDALYYKLNFENFTAVQDNEKCIQDSFTHFYWKVHPGGDVDDDVDDDHHDSSDFSAALLATIGLLLY